MAIYKRVTKFLLKNEGIIFKSVGSKNIFEIRGSRYKQNFCLFYDKKRIQSFLFKPKAKSEKIKK